MKSEISWFTWETFTVAWPITLFYFGLLVLWLSWITPTASSTDIFRASARLKRFFKGVSWPHQVFAFWILMAATSASFIWLDLAGWYGSPMESADQLIARHNGSEDLARIWAGSPEVPDFNTLLTTIDAKSLRAVTQGDGFAAERVAGYQGDLRLWHGVKTAMSNLFFIAAIVAGMAWKKHKAVARNAGFAVAILAVVLWWQADKHANRVLQGIAWYKGRVALLENLAANKSEDIDLKARQFLQRVELGRQQVLSGR